MTYQEWSEKYRTASERAERVSKAIVDRAREVARQAGLDPSIPFLHAHNAMLSYKSGKPWREVNYALCRRVLWLERQSWIPRRKVDAWSAKTWPTVQAWPNTNF